MLIALPNAYLWGPLFPLNCCHYLDLEIGPLCICFALLTIIEALQPYFDSIAYAVYLYSYVIQTTLFQLLLGSYMWFKVWFGHTHFPIISTVIASHMPIPVACLLSLFHPCLPLLHMCYHCFSPVPTSLLPTITDSLVCRLLLICFMPIIIISHFPYIFTVIDLHLCPFLLYVYCRMINELMWFTLMIKILAQVFKRSLDFLSTKREEHVFLLWNVLLAFPFFSFWDLPYFVP